MTSEYHWLKSSEAEQIESEAWVAAPFCTFCCFFCCCFFFFGFCCCCDSVADQTGAVRLTVDTAGRKNALAARSESIVTTARRIGFLRQLDGVGTPGDDLCDCYCGCSAN